MVAMACPFLLRTLIDSLRIATKLENSVKPISLIFSITASTIALGLFHPQRRASIKYGGKQCHFRFNYAKLRNCPSFNNSCCSFHIIQGQFCTLIFIVKTKVKFKNHTVSSIVGSFLFELVHLCLMQFGSLQVKTTRTCLLQNPSTIRLCLDSEFVKGK